MAIVRPAIVSDVPILAQLMKELDDFYGDAIVESPEERIAQIKQELFDDLPAGYVALAFEGETLVGMIAYSFAWPARGVSSMIFVKELFVSQEFRRQNVGKELFCFVCQLATERRCTRLVWQTDLSNGLALNFYSKLACSLGALSLESARKISYHLSADQIARLADLNF